MTQTKRTKAPFDWRRAVIYQIYPKSFRDVTGDGVGDLAGITAGLPYLADLGVDAVWLSPVFTSPMIDNGYDVSDYRSVNPLFGTEADFDAMIAQADRAGLKIILDLALNHTATAHPWFQDALAGGAKRDWYIWRDGRCGGAPNNWQSIFGGPAWSQPEGDAQFYLHLFDRTQADLNWENPAVRAEMADVIRYWLARGVAGFRLDVVTVISKPEGLRDVADPRPAPLYREIAGGPRLHEFLRDLRRDAFDPFGAVAIGEAPGVDPARAARLVDPDDPMLHLLYHFDLVEPRRAPNGDWDRAAFKRVFAAWDQGVGARGWNTVVLGNHDLARLVSRFGDDGAHWRESATMLLTLLLTQRGTPFLYQGDELGMTNCPFTDMGELDDVWAQTTFRLARESGASEAEAFAKAVAMTRDHARTPFQWSGGPEAGFSAARPWLKVNPNHVWLNAKAQAADPASPLAHAKRLIALRGTHPDLSRGAYRDCAPDHPDLFVYDRGETTRVMLNLRAYPVAVGALARPSAPLLANLAGERDPDVLAPFEARVYG